jgi:general secretion pathway protein L
MATMTIADHVAPPAIYIVSKAVDDPEGSWFVRRRSGDAEVLAGRLVQEEGHLRHQPRSLMDAMKGGWVHIAVPDGWFMERPLDPVPVKSKPFLDAYVRRQIERVTPWRAEDCFYSIKTSLASARDERLDVSVLVLLQRLVSPVITALTTAQPRHLSIRPMQAPAGEKNIDIHAVEAKRLAGYKRRAGIAVALLAVSLTSAIFASSWYQAWQTANIAELDDVIAARQNQISTINARMTVSNAASDQVPLAASPAVSRTLDRLSQILPDFAYLTNLELDGQQVKISGISDENVAALIPLIERTAYFLDVHFYAPTTRLENDTGQRFYLAMKVTGPTSLNEGTP